VESIAPGSGPPGICQIGKQEGRHIDRIAVEKIAHCKIEGPEPHGGQRRAQLRQRRHHRHEHMLERRLRPDACVAMDKVMRPRVSMLASTAPKGSPADRSGASSKQALTVVNTSGQRRRSRHQHGADPQSPESCRRRYLIAAALRAPHYGKCQPAAL
jgi:hypothetical protein